MSVLEEDLVIYRGVRFRYDLAITDGGVAIDTTGYSAELQVRENTDSEIVLLELSTTSGQLSFVDSSLLIRIPGDETEIYTFPSGEYDVKIWPPSGEPNADLVMKGKFITKKLITRSA